MNKTGIVSSADNLEYIDVVRGIAILLVILIHTSKEINGLPEWIFAIGDYGQMGVQLFFIVSAYTLCFSYTRRKQEDKALISFFIRRFFRIAPLYYLAIIGYFLSEPLTYILAKNRMPYSQYNFESIAANILFIHGFVISANNNVVPGGWSIGAEMAFYLVFPMLFTLFSWAYKQRGMIALYGLVGFSVLLNITIQWTIREFFLFMEPFQGRMTIESNPFIYWNFINQLPVFLIGMTIFFSHQNRVVVIFSIPIQIEIFIFLTTISVKIFQYKQDLVLMFIPVCAGISFGFLLNILQELKYSNRLLEGIGQVSYSMYIVHFIFALYLAPKAIDKLPKTIDPHLLLLFSFISVTSLTFLVAIFTQKYIEAPGIRLGKIIISRL
ncbi:acyltransferase [Chamaesiphon sp. VAR_48_metabat_135_sub]|uniref:acyltransferase family protein n=1 Tax=Chamaesiphon sp. VAR_48_metabat_135_sub TaxID=2964699 RepID=UPI00286CD715|nr:acyltransferase [Chamaesiphon sp. VAR_48_metabat_135_sub]